MLGKWIAKLTNVAGRMTAEQKRNKTDMLQKAMTEKQGNI